MMKLNCEGCGKEIQIDPEFTDVHSRYCSPECATNPQPVSFTQVIVKGFELMARTLVGAQ